MYEVQLLAEYHAKLFDSNNIKIVLYFSRPFVHLSFCSVVGHTQVPLISQIIRGFYYEF